MRTRARYLLASVVASAGLAGQAHAASCRSWGCVERQISSLQSQLKQAQNEAKQARSQVNALKGCLQELPVTRYPQAGSGGYVYYSGGGSEYTNALDITNTGTTVDEWVLADQCNNQPLPAHDSSAPDSSVFEPIAPEAPQMFSRSPK